jgi:Uma2 family endonuclease
MVVSAAHDRFKTLIGVILFVLAETLHKEIRGFGSFTHQRDDLARGLEPDQCYYVANVPAIEGKLRIDLAKDPPPDLSIEVEVSRSVLDRLSILAALRVPEVWRVHPKRIEVLVLREGAYEPSRRGLSFPEIDVSKLAKFLRIGAAHGEMAMARELRAWLMKLKKVKPK